MKSILKSTFSSLLFISMSTAVSPVFSKTNQATLSLKEFIQQATKNDTTFETILIDQLTLKHRRVTLLPDSNVIMDVKYQHNFYLNQNSDEAEATLSLNKLFPYNGTQLSLSYNKAASGFTTTDSSSLQFLITQPIAQNAFGKGTQLQDQIIGIENDISRYQIVEAYEDYLASLTTAYYNWYTAYENLKVGQSSYKSNKKLMDQIRDRQRQKIALAIDVNKMQLLLIGKKENVIVLKEVYDNYSNLIFKAIRHKGVTPFIPIPPGRPAEDVQFEADYNKFTQSSRTYRTLNLLEQQGTMQVKKAADDLLPSTNLLLGYQLEGKEWGIQNQERSYFAGISVRWPIGRSIDKAKQSIAKIEHKKTMLSNQNKYEELRTNLKNIYLQIQREQKLIALAKKKIKLSESILKDEAKNYSFGKVTLNDYIAAVNRVDENRFSFTDHSVQLNKLLVEWLRLTDQLVNESVLESNNK
ncbi:MAG: TolC family protein [Gammaproteobacteria bacterium]|nr:TolC family protein [Gammaproteobacteria bacterium]